MVADSGSRTNRLVLLSSLAVCATLLGAWLAVPAPAHAVDVSTPTLGGVSAASSGATPDFSNFQPGFIISDEVFFDSTSMSLDAIQSFLNAQVPACASGSTCLKDYRDVTRAIPADAMCSAYDGGFSESAASIISKVATACGINPRVILVTLQKEQSLVTSTSPSATRYRIAMGQGCPDTAACDSRYYGFFNQVFGAAWQFKRYANPPGTKPVFTWYAPGRTWNILYSPTPGCGSSPVLIQNQATANLYYYTPYQPDSAALAAGWGRGGDCSSYGNRNFYAYFTTWFGSTRYVVRGAIAEEFAQTGGQSGPLGAPRENERLLPDGGYAQDFVGGTIVWSPSTGAHAVRGMLRLAWGAVGWTSGALGYPIEDERTLADGGRAQDFQGGTVVWSSATGAYSVTSAIRAAWGLQGWTAGALGYPTENARALPEGGLAQDFSGGTITLAPGASTAYAVGPPIRQLWGERGWATGSLGFPTSSAAVGSGNLTYQTFAGGVVAASPAGVFVVAAPLATRWLGGKGTIIGAPTAEAVPLSDGGVSQSFANGILIASPRGSESYLVRGGIGDRWRAEGASTGRLGYPVSDEQMNGPGVYVQTFSGGTIVWSASAGSQIIDDGTIAAAWTSRGGASGWLGLPSERTRILGQASLQRFAGATVVSGPAGLTLVMGGIRATWEASQEAAGPLGLPTGPQRQLSDSIWAQDFVGGTIVWSAYGGFSVSGQLRDAWGRAGWALGSLGVPIEFARSLIGGGLGQDFSGGTVVEAAGGQQAYFVKGAIRQAWGVSGWTTGSWGFPIEDERRLGPASYQQRFQNGVASWTPGTGVIWVRN